MAKKMGNKGISVFLVAILISLVGSVLITFMFYSEHQQYAEQTEKTTQELINEVNQLRNRLIIIEKFIPAALLDRMYEGGSISMTYLEVINFTVSGIDTKAIVFNNSGNYPLTDFKVLLNENEIEPYYKPAIVFPEEKGIVVLYPSQFIEWLLTEGTIEAKSAQDVSIKVRTGKGPTGLAGSFVLIK